MMDGGDKAICQSNRPNIVEGYPRDMVFDGRIYLKFLFEFDLASGNIYMEPGPCAHAVRPAAPPSPTLSLTPSPAPPFNPPGNDPSPKASDRTCPHSHPYCAHFASYDGWCYNSDEWDDHDYSETNGRGYCVNHNSDHKVCTSSYPHCSSNGWCYKGGSYSSSHGKVNGVILMKPSIS